MLLSIPYTTDLPVIGRSSLTLLFNTFMLIAIWSMTESRRFFYCGVGLALAIAAISASQLFGITSSALETGGLFLMLVFASISAWIAGRDVFCLRRANFNALIGAFCVYALIGFIWAILFRLLNIFSLATFSDPLIADHQLPFSELVYFSFVTLASLGYGDITPTSGLARSLAYLEALVGQFYLAVLVASLVSAYIARYRSFL